MPPHRPQPDPDRLLAELTSLRILDLAAGQEQLNNFRATAVGNDGLAFVEFLTRSSALTSYQADQVLSGNGPRLVCGAYLIAEPVGAGELGPTYRAIGRDDRKSYALEVLPLRNLWNVHLAKQQLRAIQGLPAHPTVVPIVTIDSASWCHYLAWPFVPGESLDRLVGRGGPVDLGQAVRTAADLADGLTILHKHNLYHGLIKPANVVIDPDRRARLLKLGVGTVLGENLAEDDSLLDTISSANSAIGMIDYTAPELIGDPTARTAAGDAYSLGGLLYFMLTGRSPFPDGLSVNKMVAVMQSMPVPVRDLRPDVPDPLADLIGRLLRKSPAERPADIGAVRDELLALARTAPKPSSSSLFVPPPVFQPQAMTLFPDTGMAFPQIPAERLRDSDALSWTPVTRSAAADAPAPDRAFDPPSYSPIPAPSVVRSDRPTPPPVVPVPPGPADWSPLRPQASDGAYRGAAPVERPSPARGQRLRLFGWRQLRRVWPRLPARDLVQISVFGPPAFAPGESTAVRVYLHQYDAFVSVLSLAHADRADDQFLAAGFASRLVVRGTDRAAVHLGIGGMRIADPVVEADWTGATWHITFPVTVPPTIRSELTPGVVTLGLGGIASGRAAFRSPTGPITGPNSGPAFGD